jgi:hypothetical protein
MQTGGGVGAGGGRFPGEISDGLADEQLGKSRLRFARTQILLSSEHSNRSL